MSGEHHKDIPAEELDQGKEKTETKTETEKETKKTGTEMKYYVAITGLEIKSMWCAPQFWYHAIPSMRQAKTAAGNIYAEGNSIQGIQHTLTVWDCRKSMMTYMRYVYLTCILFGRERERVSWGYWDYFITIMKLLFLLFFK